MRKAIPCLLLLLLLLFEILLKTLISDMDFLLLLPQHLPFLTKILPIFFYITIKKCYRLFGIIRFNYTTVFTKKMCRC